MTSLSLRLHPLHRVWRALPIQARRRWLARASAWAAPRPDPAPPERCDGVVVGGELGRASGLGEASRIMLQALQRLGVRTAALDLGTLQAPWARSGPIARQDWPDRAALVLHVNAPELPGALIRLGRAALRGRRVIGQWYWELPTVPTTWHPALSHVHEVWAPSQFTARALEPLLPGRVRVVPIALALAPPVPSRLDRQAFGLPADALVVLTSFSLASSFERKNPLAAIAAFREAFGSRLDRLLLLKIGHVEHHAEELARIRQATAGAANIRIETRMLPDGDMHALTRACDIVLSLHRSEGFGLVPAQAMLLGRAVVATDWSATTEFLDARNGMPVRYRLVPARDPRGVFEAEGAMWADADVHDAARALRELAGSADRRQALGAEAAATTSVRLGADGLRRALAGIGVGAR